jgi:hypothetical protein
MSKRRPAKTPKRVRSPKIAAQAQRAAQAIVRSPRDNRPRPVAAVSAESPHEQHSAANQEARPVENSPAVLQTAPQDDLKESTMTNPEGSLFFPAATTNIQAYQATLQAVAHANLQFSLEFAQRLAAIRSPIEYLGVITDFTSKRIDMFRKHSKELAELSIWKRTA